MTNPLPPSLRLRGKERHVGGVRLGVSPGDSDIWAVTSFFNPVGYRSHREKYLEFREHLAVPLVAVELAYGGPFELGPGDADCLIRLRSRHVLWQKERLLNLAVDALPPEVRYVVWVDSDVVFQREDWYQETKVALENHALVQPYERVHDLPPGAHPGPDCTDKPLLTRPSLAAVARNGGFHPAGTSTNMLEVGSPGHAWAMRRDHLAAVGLYDAMILGSGDNAMAMAGLGHVDAYVKAYRMNRHEEDHYRQWAERFFEIVRGDVGMVAGDLYHLWHGDLEDRGYGERYPGLAPFRFNPFEDIALDAGGAWRWATRKPGLHRYVKSYFDARKEDG